MAATGTSGTFTVNDPDSTVTVSLSGPAGLVSGGETVSWSWDPTTKTLTGTADGEPVMTVVLTAPSEGTNGEYGYTVELLQPVKHGEGTSTDGALNLDFKIIVSDSIAAPVEQTLTVTITDDDPQAKADVRWVGEDAAPIVDGQTSYTLSGNVVNGTAQGEKADVVGADGSTVTGAVVGSSTTPVTNGTGVDSAEDGSIVLKGTYGDLTIQSDGSYTYTLATEGDSRYEALQGLGGKGTDTHLGKETFTYTLTDGDGDTSTAALTINVHGVNDAPTADPQPNNPAIEGVNVILTDESLDHSNKDTGNGAYQLSAPNGDHGNDNSHSITGIIKVSDPDTDVADLEVSFGNGAATAVDLGVTVEPGSDGEGTPLTARGGEPVQWRGDGAGGLIAYVGTVGDNDSYLEVIKVTLDSTTTGEDRGYTVELLQPIDHPVTERSGDVGGKAVTDLGTEDVIDIKIPVFVSDGQGGQSETLITVRIEDDSPEVIGDAANLTMVSGAAETAWTGSLGISVGADFENAHVQIVAGDKTSLEGKPVLVTLEGVSEPVALTSDKTPLVYYVQTDGSVIAVKQGDTTLEPVFTISGNAQSNTYTVTLQGVIDPPAGTVTSHLEGATFTSSSGGVSATVGGDVPFSIGVSGSSDKDGKHGQPGWNGGRLGIGNGDGYIDGQHNEKLIFTITPKGSEHVSSVEIQVYDLKKGETALIYINGNTDPIEIKGIPNDSNSYQTFIIRVPEGEDSIKSIALGAAGSNDYSVTSFELGYETGTAIDPNAAMSLGLGAIVTDGDGDAIQVDLNVSVIGTPPPVTATLTSEGSGDEDSGQVTYTVTLGSIATEAQSFDVTLTNGQTITITVAAGQATGSVALGWGDALTEGKQQLGGYPNSDPYEEADFALEVTTFEPSATGSSIPLDVQDQSGAITIGDTPDVTSADIKVIVTHTAEINNGNVETSPSFEVTAYKSNGKSGEISIVTGTDHDGFGVKGQTSGGANEAELGYGTENGKGDSERIVVVFKNEVKAFDVEFAWRNNTESAKVQFFDGENNSVGWAIISGGGSDGKSAVVTYYNAKGEETKTVTGVSGGSDKVDAYYTFEPAEGQTFVRAEFTAVGHDDDYLIHSIRYQQVVSEDVTTIVKGSEVLVEIVTTNPPDPALFGLGALPVYAQVKIGDQTYNVQLDKDGRGTQTVTFNGDGDLDIEVLGVNGNYEEFDPAQLTLVQSVLILDAVDDHIITNINNLHSVDASVVTANDTLVDGNTKPLGAVPLAWIMPGADFGTFNVKTVDFTSKKSSSLELDRADFSTKNQSNQASIKVNGHLADDDKSHNSDRITVYLNAGETLKASWNHSGDFKMEWVRVGDDDPSGLKSGNSFTAQESGEYQLHIRNTDDEHNSYKLDLTINYADVQPIATGDYQLETSDGTHSDSAHVTVEYQSGNTLKGTDGNDTLLAGDSKGATLNGGQGDDVLIGGAKGDTLNGGAGNDTLIGGKGSDALTGGAGDDVFVWRFGDQSDSFTGYGRPSDKVTDFGVGQNGLGHDKLDLSDLLQNVGDGADLSHYLQITGSGNKTTINVSTDGQVSNNHYDQQIVIDNVNLTNHMESGYSQNDLINSLIDTGKLKVDQG